LAGEKIPGESVPGEINKISAPVTILRRMMKTEFPFSELKIKNKQVIKMPGGHHYDGDVNALCNKINSQIK